MSVTRAVIALLCLAGPAALAQQGVQQGLVIQTETRTVLVEAIVTGKKGEQVHDLTAKDFRIWQDGKEQAVTSISAEAKSADPHFLVLFFDDTQIAPPDRVVARQAVSRFIDANAAPGRLMAVVSYSGSLSIAQNFTNNAVRLKDALNRVEASGGLTANSRPGQLNTAAAADNFGSRNMMQALTNLTKSLGVLPGRKTVVLLTGGIPSSSDLKSEVAAAIEASSRSDVAIYPVNVTAVSSTVNRVKDPFGPTVPGCDGCRAGPQGVDYDSRTGTQDPAESSQSLLLTLASGTGGFVTRDPSDLLRGLQQIGEEQTEHYVLSYTPPESKEGSCHGLRVKVDRAGATVRARSSYCATKPVDLAAATPAAKELESRAAGADTGNLKASIQLPYFYVSPTVARVHLAMEIAPDGLKFENQKGKLHAEVNLLGIATRPDGSIGARVTGTLPFDFENQAAIEKVKDAPAHYEKDFKITPGEYSFALAFGAGGNSFGKIELPLDVEPWNVGQLTLSSVALSRETHPAADLGLVSSLVEDPLVAEGAQFVPSGSSQFSQSEMGFFYLEVYDPNPASVRLQVRVLDRKTGEPKWDAEIAQLSPSSIGGRSSAPAGGSLRLGALATGVYRLEITASDSAGNQAKRTVDFEVK
jgi:VWFA-related protein